MKAKEFVKLVKELRDLQRRVESKRYGNVPPMVIKDQKCKLEKRVDGLLEEWLDKTLF
jgi:hypothetical protein